MNLIERMRRRRGGLPWTASHEHELQYHVRRLRWPPFFAHARFFLPRFKLQVKNRGPDLDLSSIQVDVAPYEGPLGRAPHDVKGWVDVRHIEIDERWEHAEERTFRIRLPDSGFPRPGSYIMRLSVTRWVPAGTPRQQMMRAMATPEVTNEVREQVIRTWEQHTQVAGIDPDAPQPGTYTGEIVSTLTVLKYIHVEPTSSVLTFWVATGSVVTALATLALAFAVLLGA